MKLSELIKQLQEIESSVMNDEVDIGMSDCMTVLIISKIKHNKGITVLEPIKTIHCD